MNCKIPDRKKILYIFGELSDSERQEMELHLSSCERCSDEFKKLRETFETVGALSVEEPSDECIAGIRELPVLKEGAGKPIPSRSGDLSHRKAWETPSGAGISRGRLASPWLRWGIPAFGVGLAAFILIFSSLQVGEETVRILPVGKPLPVVKSVPTEIEWEDVEALAQAEDEISFSFLTHRTMEDEIAIMESEIDEVEVEIGKITGGGENDEDISNSGDGIFERSLRLCRTEGRVFLQG